jgi:hypothetical protein
MRRRPARGDTNLPAASVMRLAALCLLLLLLLPTACSAPPPLAAESGPIEVTLHVDGDSHNLTTRATNVRELLAEAGITTAPADEVTPPPFTPLQEGMEVVVVRVEELVEVIEESPAICP